jgi:hypothetical protein
LVRFLHSPAVAAWRPGIIEHGLSRHLRDLFDSLGEVDAGAPAALFKPPPGPKVASPAEEEFRGKVAAVVGLLLDAGADLEGACRLIAHDLDKIGYRRPYGRKKGTGNDRITGGTVRAWRKKAMEAPRDSRIGSALHDYLALARRYGAVSGDPPGRVAAKMLAGLAQDLPDGRNFITPVTGTRCCAPCTGDPKSSNDLCFLPRAAWDGWAIGRQCVRRSEAPDGSRPPRLPDRGLRRRLRRADRARPPRDQGEAPSGLPDRPSAPHSGGGRDRVARPLSRHGVPRRAAARPGGRPRPPACGPPL